MTKTITPLAVSDYEPRMGSGPEHPCGFINFTDGLRIGFAPGVRQADEDGLFNCNQPYLVGDRELDARHVTLAREFVRTILKPELARMVAEKQETGDAPAAE